MERSRRQPVQSGAAAKAKSALEQLRAAREGGGKRALTYEVKEEQAVYDVVDDHQYAEIVKKRRDAGAFVVDDDGTGDYADFGDDDYWNERPDDEEGGSGDEEGSGGKHANKKRKKDHGKGALKGAFKGKAAEGESSPPKPEGANITAMFRKAAATRAGVPGIPRTAAGPKPTDASSDDVLDSILGDIMADTTPAPTTYGSGLGVPRSTPAVGAAIYGVYSRPVAARPTPTHLAMGSMPRPGAAYGGTGLAAVASLASAAATAPPPVRAAVIPAAVTAPAPAVNPVTGAATRHEPSYEDDAMHHAGAFPDDDLPDAANPAVADEAPVPVQPEPVRGAADAPTGRNFVEAPETPLDGAQAHRAEDVWDEMYADGSVAAADPADGGSLAAAPDSAAAATPVGSAAASGDRLDASGMMPFYLLDAYDNPDARPGEVVLFGKVQAEGRWQSCSAVVRGLQRCLLVVPRPEVWEDNDGAISALEEAVAADPSRRVELIKLLQERCAAVRKEVRGLLSRAGVSSLRMVPVKRSYGFENKAVPRQEQWVLKVRYPAHMPTLTLPAGGTLSGSTFVAIFGAQQSPLEALLLKRRIKGPGWLGISQPQRVEYANQSTWCKVEVAVDGPKRLLSQEKGLTPDAVGRPAPPLVVASLSLKTQLNPTNHQQEIFAASVVHMAGVSPDAPLPISDWSNGQRLRSFSIVRRLDGQAWPQDMEAAAGRENSSARGKANGGNMVQLQASERSLLTSLLARLQSLDADVLVGHSISSLDLTTLLARLQHHKVPLWSRIGRIKKTEFPRLTGGGHTYGGGAGAGVLSAVAGRLLCDTYLAARELVRSVDYTLQTLAQSQLKQVRSEPYGGGGPGGGLASCYGTAEGVIRLLKHGETDAWLALGLMVTLSVLPLTKQLSVLSGQLWSRTLAGQRAQRIEMLLLHEFHARKFILPDKPSFKDKQRRQMAEAEEDELGGGEEDGDTKPGGKKAGKAAPKSNGPKYSGGLVLEPKKGLYDKIVIILDFNSLYPSIIQEYNICFTTVQRPEDGSLPPLPDPATAANGLAPLPSVLQALVNRRRQVKQAMASERNPLTWQQLHVRQQAIKLTANSMYGCLGFGASRFYAQPLAELITAQGRSILSSTVELVQGSIGAEVIYGDTDSIMVATGTDSVDEARALGAKIKREVNKRYKLLEIELDGVFRSILLLKKKKYAAMKLEPDGNGKLVEVLDKKGLDIVRRDWCPLCKEVGGFALDAILSGRNREEVVAEIHAHLRQVAERVRAGQIHPGKYVITKQLTKRPEDYPDAKNQPHVQVALRRRAAGKRDGVMPGETVPYIICVDRAPPAAADGAASEPGAAATPAALGGCSGSLAERARHIEELRENTSLAVDVEYYLAQQIHPVVSRLVSPIEGTDAAHIADCLGLDPSRYRGFSGTGGAGAGDDEDSGLLAGTSGGTLMDEDDNFRSCVPLMLASPNGSCFPLRGVAEVLRGAVMPEHLLTPPDALGDDSARVGPAALTNQVLLRAREVVARYYDGVLRADDETAEVAGGCRAGVLRPAGGGEEGPAGPDRMPHPDPSRQGVLLRRAVSERDLYLQLSHFYRLLHVEGAVRRHVARLKATDPKSAVTLDDVRAMVPEPLARTLAAAAEAVDSLRRRSHWHWVDLSKLFGSLTAPPAPASLQQQQPQPQQQTARLLLAGGGAMAAGSLSAVRGMVA